MTNKDKSKEFNLKKKKKTRIGGEIILSNINMHKGCWNQIYIYSYEREEITVLSMAVTDNLLKNFWGAHDKQNHPLQNDQGQHTAMISSVECLLCGN